MRSQRRWPRHLIAAISMAGALQGLILRAGVLCTAIKIMIGSACCIVVGKYQE